MLGCLGLGSLGSRAKWSLHVVQGLGCVGGDDTGYVRMIRASLRVAQW